MSELTELTPVKLLPVPYFVQPTSFTCQSTCLKMMACYLDANVVRRSSGIPQKDILDIFKELKAKPGGPYAHSNWKAWLESRYPSLAFDYFNPVKKEEDAFSKITTFIDSQFPVLMSVSHPRTAGHIVLVIGYQLFCVDKGHYRVIVHDPYGQFDPSLQSKAYAQERWRGGSSLAAGGERGPGKNCVLPIASLSRQRNGGHYVLLSGHRTYCETP